MKKILISLSILLLMSGCDNEDKMLSVNQTVLQLIQNMK